MTLAAIAADTLQAALAADAQQARTVAMMVILSIPSFRTAEVENSMMSPGSQILVWTICSCSSMTLMLATASFSRKLPTGLCSTNASRKQGPVQQLRQQQLQQRHQQLQLQQHQLMRQQPRQQQHRPLQLPRQSRKLQGSLERLLLRIRWLGSTPWQACSFAAAVALAVQLISSSSVGDAAETGRQRRLCPPRCQPQLHLPQVPKVGTIPLPGIVEVMLLGKATAGVNRLSVALWLCLRSSRRPPPLAS